MEEETYLGDGLYASFDGYQVKLRAPGFAGDNEVYLDPTTLKAFRDFIKQLEEAAGTRR